MIRAIIFDCFGVLATEGWIPLRDTYLRPDAEKLQEAARLLKELTTGRITDRAFREAIAPLAGITPNEVREHMYANTPNEQLFTYIEGLDPNIKIAMLSNAGKNRLHEIFTIEQLALFDVCAVSSEIGYAKPDEEAYRHVVKLLGVMPDQCVFVDDQQRYLDGAQSVGMSTILYADLPQFILDIESLLTDS